MDKARIIQEILKQLAEELKLMQKANERASMNATDSETRAESKWDTQGLESSYLARGYAQQYEAFSQQANELQSMEVESFEGKAIGIGALTQLELNGFQSWYLMLGGCGGMEVDVDGEEVTVITPDSPLAQAILSKRKGDSFQFREFSNSRIVVVE